MKRLAIIVVGILILGLSAAPVLASHTISPPRAGVSDVVTTNAAAIPTALPQITKTQGTRDEGEVWVDGGWAGHGAGDIVDGHIFGTDAFVTIQEGINAVADPGLVHVAAGTYTENITVNKSVTVDGAGADLTIVEPAVSDVGTDAGPSFGGSQVIVVQAHGVVISNLTVDGDNPGLPSGVIRHGADIDARNGIIEADGPWNGLTVHHCTVRNIYLRGVYARSGGTGFHFHHNTVQNVDGGLSSIAMFAFGASGVMEWNEVSDSGDALSANWSAGIQFLNNTVTNCASGVHTDNSSGHDLIQLNHVSNSAPGGYGVWAFFPYTDTTIDQNTVTNVEVALFAWGHGGAGTGGIVSFTNNTVDGEGRSGCLGAYVTCGPDYWGSYQSNVSATFAGNSVSNTGYGFYAETDESGSYSTTIAVSGWTGFAGNTVDVATFGIGSFSITGLSGNTVEVDHPGKVQLGVDLAASGGAVTVQSGTFDADHQISIGKAVTVQGAGAGASILDGGGTSLGSSGLIRITSGEGPVTFSGFTLQGAGADPGGDNITVYARGPVSGPQFTVSDCDLIGSSDPANHGDYGVYLPGGRESFVLTRCRIERTGGNPILIENHSGATEVSHCTFDRGVADNANDAYFNMNHDQPTITTLQEVSNNTIDLGSDVGPYDYDHRSTGISFAGAYTGTNGGYSNVRITDNTIQDVRPDRRGIGLWNNAGGDGSGGAIAGAVITGNTIVGTGGDGSMGIRLLGLATGTAVRENAVSNVATSFQGRAWNGHIASGTTVADNSFTDIAETLDWQGTGILDASGNWWGTNTQGAVAAVISGNVDYTPWLDTGVDTSTDPGFQGDFGNLWVSAASPQSGTQNRIQESVSLVSGSTIHLLPGTYSGSTTIDRTLTLEGAGNGADPVSSTILNGGGGVALLLTAGGSSIADRLVLRDFRITGSTNGIRTEAAIDHVTLEDLVVAGNSSYGLEVHNTAIVNDLVLEGCSFTGQVGSLGVRMRGSVTGFRASGCHFDGNDYGFQTVKGCGDGTVFDDVQYSDCTFSNNTFKGAYFEKLSHASFTDCVFENDGFGTTAPVGVDVNLKYGAYSDLSFTRVRMTSCGTGDPAGSGFAIKGRNDGSYASCPASLDNVSLQDVIVSGCPIGITVGNNVTGVVVGSSTVSGNTVAGLVNWTDGTGDIDARSCWWGSSTGPYHPTGNPSGTGNPVSDRVLFVPFRTGNVVFVPDPQEISLADPVEGGYHTDLMTIRYLGGGGGAVYGFSLRLDFDPTKADVVSITPPASGAFHNPGLFQVVGPPTVPVGTRIVDVALGGDAPGTLGPDDLVVVKFKGLACWQPASANIDLTPRHFRDRLNHDLTGFLEQDGTLKVDLGAPVVASAVITRTNLPETGYVKYQDVVDITANVDDECSGLTASGITADLTQIGGAAAVNPTSYAGGIATWTGVTINVSDPGLDGSKTIAITATDPLGNSATLDPAAGVYLDNTKPAAVTGLTAAPGHNKIELAWGNPTGDPSRDNYGIMIRRSDWDDARDYPVYGNPAPVYPDSNQGVRVYRAPGMVTSYQNDFAATGMERDIYYYQAFIFDRAYNYSPASSGAQDRANNYWLGDVAPITGTDFYNYTAIGNGRVETGDISALGSTYYLDPGNPSWNPHCDVGPTDDGSRTGVPVPDRFVDFEDLMIFAMNFGVVAPLSGGATHPVVADQGVPALLLRTDPAGANGSVTAHLLLQGNRAMVKGIHAVVGLDRSKCELLDVSGGSLVSMPECFFKSVDLRDGVAIDAALLGENLVFAGSGEVATLRFRMRPAAARPLLGAADLRDAENGKLGVPAQEGLALSGSENAKAGAEEPVVPSELRLFGARPNPFAGATEILFALPRETAVSVRIFDAGGRLVRTLVSGVLPAGDHALGWDGRNLQGQKVGAGAYFYTFRAGTLQETHKLFLYR